MDPIVTRVSGRPLAAGAPRARQGPVPAGGGGDRTGIGVASALESGTVQNGNALAFDPSGSAGLPDRLQETHATTRAATLSNDRGWWHSRGRGERGCLPRCNDEPNQDHQDADTHPGRRCPLGPPPLPQPPPEKGSSLISMLDEDCWLRKIPSISNVPLSIGVVRSTPKRLVEPRLAREAVKKSAAFPKCPRNDELTPIVLLSFRLGFVVPLFRDLGRVAVGAGHPLGPTHRSDGLKAPGIVNEVQDVQHPCTHHPS